MKASAPDCAAWIMLLVESYFMPPFEVEVAPAPTGTRNAFATVDPLRFNVIAAVPVLTALLRTANDGSTVRSDPSTAGSCALPLSWTRLLAEVPTV